MINQESLRGHYLVAAKEMRDATFYRTAILILDHNEEGTMGLIVNRPSSVSVAHALSSHFPVPESERMIHFGGPVEPAALCILHNDEVSGKNDHSLMEGVYIGSHEDVFEDVVSEESESYDHSEYRVFSGYSGWSPGQLEVEIDRGDWHIVKGDARFVFDIEPYSIWDNLFEEIYKRNRFFDCPTNHVEWN